MQQETIENYCKAICALDGEEGAKSVDIANRLGISKISVSITLHKLKDEGYIAMKRYGRVKLAQKGKEIAKKIGCKHEAIMAFLQKCLGVEKGRAMREACAIEHHLSDETVKKMSLFCKKCKN